MDKDKMAESILHLTLEILFRLTGEDYTVVKKTSSERCQALVSKGWGRALSKFTGSSPHPLIRKDINDQKILELTYKMIELLTGEVPIGSKDVAVYLSMEEWEYLEGHKYKDVVREVPQPLKSPAVSSKRTTPERHLRPLLLDCKQENPIVPQDHQVPTVSISLSGHLLYKRMFLINTSRMDRNRDKMAERILNLSLEILFRLTGEDYTVVKKTSSESCQAPESEGLGRPHISVTGPPLHLRMREDFNDLKILKVTYKMIELLTGEVPLRCQDVAVYFSMEEWEYLEGHKDLYKDVMMEVPQPLTSPGLSRKRTTPERCPRPLLPQDCNREEPSVPQDHQGEDLTHINTTETYVKGDERNKGEILTDNRPDNCPRTSEEQLTSSVFKSDDLITQDITEVNATIPDIPSSLHSKVLSSDPFKQVLTSGSSKTIKKNKSPEGGIENQTALPAKKSFSSAECGKSFSFKISSVAHEKIPTEEKRLSPSECGKNHNQKSGLVRPEKVSEGEKSYSCSECGKCFASESNFNRHQKSHTREMPYSCSECGKHFVHNSDLVKHQKSHKKKRPYSCSECDESFADKSYLVKHLTLHTGKKPFSCAKCGKCFAYKSYLVQHQKTHTGVKPFSCSECGKSCARKTHLIDHLRTHTGEKPFACTECGKRFIRKKDLTDHHITHTGEKPYLCSECGKCFGKKSHLVEHRRTHTGEKPYPCSECRKCFGSKTHLVAHLRTHTGEKPFSCSECGKCFAHKQSMISHQKSH